MPGRIRAERSQGHCGTSAFFTGEPTFVSAISMPKINAMFSTG
jgi:hypothetical protein